MRKSRWVVGAPARRAVAATGCVLVSKSFPLASPEAGKALDDFLASPEAEKALDDFPFSNKNTF